ncbi:DUF748 domain-containing protein [Salinicola halophyticus]|uniref:DUF748 domain-containing protein n=1 Tax=Salinicola halophyticus TaxID=1808881 RepID=UPI000DA1813A|nr:DUF748 domain-containing protein [Salinicola halophyticus]
MSTVARRRWVGVFALIVVLLLLVFLAGPWALTKWAENRFTDSLGTPVKIERVTFNPFTVTARFSTLRVGDGETPMIEIASGEVAFEWSTLWQSGIHISEVHLDSPNLHLVSPQSGPLNLATLGADSSSGDASSDDGSSLTIERIDASDGQIDWQDRGTGEDASIAETGVSLTLHDYQRDGDSPMQGQASGTVGGGKIDLEGRFGVMPLTGDLAITTQQVAASAIDPWLTAGMPARIDQGRVDLDGQLRFGTAANALIAYQGKVSLDDLATVDSQDQPLLSLDRGVFEGVDFALDDHLKIDSSVLTAPRLTALIDDDGQFNLMTAFAPQEEGNDLKDANRNGASQNRNDDAGMALALKRLEVKQGRFDFEDRHMSPTVALDVDGLNGQLSQLNTRSDQPAHYRFDGMESEGTPVMVEGSINLGEPLDARMRLTTKQLELSQFAPYIRRFGGYRIDHGTADLELNYHLQGSRLDAQNHIILKHLNLGKEIDQDETSLPLKRLIGLLQAKSGVINLDIPIETTVEGNTQVDTSEVVWQAVTESLGNILTSPVDSLQALMGDHDGSGDGASR